MTTTCNHIRFDSSRCDAPAVLHISIPTDQAPRYELEGEYDHCEHHARELAALITRDRADAIITPIR